jgi:hypothetical protein
MGSKPGQYLGGIRTLEELRLRCVCRESEDDCWHLRSARGRSMPTNRVHTVRIHGRKENFTATRASWLLSGKTIRTGFVVRRVCESYDCVNPKHLKQGTRGDVARHNAKPGYLLSPSQLAPLEVGRARSAKATADHVRLIVESGLPSRDLAAQVPLSRGRINQIRREWASRPACSVFLWGGA